MFIEVQFSLYPLREPEISKYIQIVIDTLKESSLPVEVGLMSSITYGESELVFKAFSKSLNALEGTHFVIVMTVSNACPLPGKNKL